MGIRRFGFFLGSVKDDSWGRSYKTSLFDIPPMCAPTAWVKLVSLHRSINLPQMSDIKQFYKTYGHTDDQVNEYSLSEIIIRYSVNYGK